MAVARAAIVGAEDTALIQARAVKPIADAISKARSFGTVDNAALDMSAIAELSETERAVAVSARNIFTSPEFAAIRSAYEEGKAVEVTIKGTKFCMSRIRRQWRRWWAIEWFSVQPVTRSVIVKVWANSPIQLGPQCATVSASITPGFSGASSAQARMAIELRSSAEGVVVAMPLIRIASRAGFKYSVHGRRAHRLQLGYCRLGGQQPVQITGAGQQR
jgi:hypothetical protein